MPQLRNHLNSLTLLLLICGALSTIGSIEINLNLTQQPPSYAHWLGTDLLGRDLLSYSLYALFYDLSIGGILSLSNISLGSMIACFWSVASNQTQLILTHIMITLKSVPKVLLILLCIGSHHAIYDFMLLSVLTQWPKYSLILKHRLSYQTSLPHCQDALYNRVPFVHLCRYHLLPSITPYIRNILPYSLMQSISSLMTLRFLGYGLNQSFPTLGQILLEQKYYPQLFPIIYCGILCLIVFSVMRYFLQTKKDPI
ncbi:ABC transporter permease subunit [Gammaproteobacteria bacterium]|nr:ABC transporter permease subunit [Gammaproteobacteria bacterium]